MPSSRGSSQPRDQTHVSLSPALAGGFFTTSAAWEAQYFEWRCFKLSMCYQTFDTCTDSWFPIYLIQFVIILIFKLPIKWPVELLQASVVGVVANSFETPWTVVHQACLSMGFSRQESWSRLPFPSPVGIEPGSPEVAGSFFTTEPPGKPLCSFGTPP